MAHELLVRPSPESKRIEPDDVLTTMPVTLRYLEGMADPVPKNTISGSSSRTASRDSGIISACTGVEVISPDKRLGKRKMHD